MFTYGIVMVFKLILACVLCWPPHPSAWHALKWFGPGLVG